MHEYLSYEEFIRMMVTMWVIRIARHKAIYEEIFQSPFATHHFITSLLGDIQILSKKGVEPTKATLARPASWIAPPEDCGKINMDAAVAMNVGYGSVGIICHDFNSIFWLHHLLQFEGFWMLWSLKLWRSRKL